MNDTLKAAGRIGAELGAAKAEVARLRGEIARAVREFDECDAFNAEGRAVEFMEELRAALSQQADHVRSAAQMMVPSEILKAIAWGDRDDAAEAIGSLRCLLSDPEGEDEIAFPDSPEPTDNYTAVDMATAAAQGFRDGQKAEPAPAQDEQQPEGLRKDAQRYRWLREQEAKDGIAVLPVGRWATPAMLCTTPFDSPEMVDAVVDAAMAAKEAEPEHVCSGCGAKGWTGNCLECIPY